MGSTYGACGGCGGIPTPVAYPYGTGYGRPGYGGIVDADPITPGIQSTPGVVTPVGPPRITGGPGFGGPGFGGPGFGGPGLSRGFGGPAYGGSVVGPAYGGRPGFGGFDADPISPGVQTRPGVITATGPSFVSGAPGGFRRF